MTWLQPATSALIQAATTSRTAFAKHATNGDAPHLEYVGRAEGLRAVVAQHQGGADHTGAHREVLRPEVRALLRRADGGKSCLSMRESCRSAELHGDATKSPRHCRCVTHADANGTDLPRRHVTPGHITVCGDYTAGRLSLSALQIFAQASMHVNSGSLGSRLTPAPSRSPVRRTCGAWAAQPRCRASAAAPLAGACRSGSARRGCG